MNNMFDEGKCLEVISSRIKNFPKMLMILGSGWNKISKDIKGDKEISYKELFGVDASVPGHEGKLVVGELDGKRVALMMGRFHMYEGYSAREVTLPLRVLAKAGLKKVIVTSASGALNQSYKVGDFVVLSDIISLFLSPDSLLVGPDFQDLSSVFDKKMRREVLSVLRSEKIAYKEGVYVYVHGPQFETPADKRALMKLGADVVGMSTVPEVIMGASLGLRVLGLSLVTNLAFVKHSHEDVLAAAESRSKKMVMVLKALMNRV